MNYIIWNKIDSINGVGANYFIENLKIKESDGVFLIGTDLDNVQCVEIDRIIKSNYELDLSLTTEQVAQEYIRIKEEEKANAEKDILTLEEQTHKISILQEENEKLKESQASQDMDIMFTQEAVDFLMLGSMSTNLKNIKLGGSNMAGYIATRIMKKGDISVEAGRNYYVTFLTHQDYAKYRAEVDLILISEGRENLIVDLTNL